MQMRPPSLSEDSMTRTNKTSQSPPPPFGMQLSISFSASLPTNSRIRVSTPRSLPPSSSIHRPSSFHRPLPPAPSDGISASAHLAARNTAPLLPPHFQHTHPATSTSTLHHTQLPSSLSFLPLPADPASARLLDSLSSAADSAATAAAAAAFLAASALSTSATATALANTAAATAAAAASASSTAFAAASAAAITSASLCPRPRPRLRCPRPGPHHPRPHLLSACPGPCRRLILLQMPRELRRERPSGH
jgi:hypothetical protein